MKNCPKCTTRLHHQVTPLGASSLERHAETSVYSGYSCHQCGTWIDDAPVVVMPEIPTVDANLARPSGERATPIKKRDSDTVNFKDTVAKGHYVQKLVESRIEWVTKKRQEGYSFQDITYDFCSDTKVEITDNTLRKYVRGKIPPELMVRANKRQVAA